MQTETWPRIAVVGAGAVGCYFGGMLAKAGAPVTLIGRANHVEAIRRDGLHLDGVNYQGCIAVGASEDLAAVRDAEVVLFCVKTLDTETVAKQMASYVAPGAVVVSLQNGVDNAERITAASGVAALAAVVYISVEMTGPGRLRHNGRGDLVVGDAGIAALFERAGVPCRISDRIAAELWTKLIMNCTYNAMSAILGTRYGRIIGNEHTREVIRQVVAECVAVAGAAGVTLDEAAMFAAAVRLGEVGMPNALSSTAQDIARGKLTEIDSLNGYVVRRGAELKVPAPVNRTLHALVKLRESLPA